ncbi:MAG: (d)CMP kinase [Bacteroidetes bacterium]|nr:(d)CMP kinase [Bacteroidota bacterium]
MPDIIIAIDGHSSTGKSTLAKKLAKELGYAFIDTGAMYRAVTLHALRKGYFNNKQLNTQALVADLAAMKLRFICDTQTGKSEMYLNGENVEAFIRSMDVSEKVSLVAIVPEVRQKLVAQQHDMGIEKGIVMDGRDIGTVVFPDAELKIFMTASAEIRAKRRFEELSAKGHQETYEDVLKNVIERDDLDSNRSESPLKKAPDSKTLDNSYLSQDEQFDIALAWAKKAIAETVHS